MKSTRLFDMLIKHEGLVLKPYQCPAGKTTIGVGRNLEDNGIDEREAMFLLSNDVARCYEEAGQFAWFAHLNDFRQEVVISMIFNLGISRFKGFRKTIAALEAGDYDTAAKEMLDSRWAQQVGKRADELAEIMKSGGSSRSQ